MAFLHSPHIGPANIRPAKKVIFAKLAVNPFNIQRPQRNFPRSIYAISSIVYTHVGLLDDK